MKHRFKEFTDYDNHRVHNAMESDPDNTDLQQAWFQVLTAIGTLNNVILQTKKNDDNSSQTDRNMARTIRPVVCDSSLPF